MNEDATNDPRNAVNEWLAMNWTTLAADGWEGYRKFGAGALVFLAEHIEADPPVFRMVSVRYFSRAQLRWRGALDVVDRYDPQREIVVLVLFEDMYVSNKTAGIPTPPQAFAMRDAQLN